MNEAMKKELQSLSSEMLQRREKIRQEWHENHPDTLRGTISTPEMKAIDKEEKRRYGEILKKYNQ